MGSEVSRVLIVLKASSCSGPQWNLFSFLTSLVRGSAFSEKLGMNFLKKDAMPTNLLTCLEVTGLGKFSMTSMLRMAGEYPVGAILCPKKVISLTANWHFLGLSFRINSQNDQTLFFKMFVKVGGGGMN